MLGSWYYYNGGINECLDNFIATVFPLPFYSFVSCYHSYDGNLIKSVINDSISDRY